MASGVSQGLRTTYSLLGPPNLSLEKALHQTKSLGAEFGLWLSSLELFTGGFSDLETCLR